MRSNVESIRKGSSYTRPLLSLSSFLLSVVVGLVSSFTYSAAYDMARTALYREPPAVSGLWRGYWRDVPAVTLRLEQKEGALAGTVRFTRVIKTKGGTETLGESPEIPLVNPRFEGKRLLFELIVTEAMHPTIPVEMEMSFEDEETGRLRSTRRDGLAVTEEDEPAIRMLRASSF